MLLAVDIGNTNVVLGVYRGATLLQQWRVASDTRRMPDEYAMILRDLLTHHGFALSDIDGAIVGSVVPPLTTVFDEMCRRYFGIAPLIVGPGIRTGVRISYDDPRGVGADRIVNSLAAFRLYGGPAVIIDFGTATTFDAISATGDYLGGAIAPGIGLAAEALFQHTAKLPRVELVTPRTAIGKNTPSAMQSGLILGYVGLVEGLVARFTRELGGKGRVIATGGLAPLVAKETACIEVVNSGLTLDGLRMLYELNTGYAGGDATGAAAAARE
jgi:type III pantothenate kinase